jgi:hypothetical protein
MFNTDMDFSEMLALAAEFLLKSGMNSAVFVVVGLMLAVALTRKMFASKWAWLSSDLGAATYTVALGVAMGVANALLAGGAASWSVVFAAFGVAVQAAGGYSLLKKLALPALDKLEPKLPAALRWLVPVLRMMIAAFGAKASAAADAKAAGDKAVSGKPSSGAAGVIGKPTEYK